MPGLTASLMRWPLSTGIFTPEAQMKIAYQKLKATKKISVQFVKFVRWMISEPSNVVTNFTGSVLTDGLPSKDSVHIAGCNFKNYKIDTNEQLLNRTECWTLSFVREQLIHQYLWSRDCCNIKNLFLLFRNFPIILFTLLQIQNSELSNKEISMYCFFFHSKLLKL